MPVLIWMLIVNCLLTEFRTLFERNVAIPLNKHEPPKTRVATMSGFFSKIRLQKVAPSSRRKQPPKHNKTNENSQQPNPLTPQSHSFSQSYGAILPTSLTYIILINQRLCTLETCCGYGYGLVGNFNCVILPRIFKGQC